MSQAAGSERGSAFRSLHNRNFRLYQSGQVISQTGSWFQQTAEIWLIVLLTGSGTAVGLATALRFGPLLLFGIPAGLLSDRLDRWTLLFATQSVYLVAALVLAIATFTSTPTVLLVYAMILAQGIVAAIDNPLRRTFVRDLVTDEELQNAVSLNSTVHTLARAVGPALAGILIVAVGVSVCFAINAVSYAAVLVTLWMIDRKTMRPSPRVAAAPGQLRDGFRYARANPRIRRTLIMATVLGLSVLNWNVIMPLYATQAFGGDASLYGLMVGVLGIGAFVGAIVVARFMTVSGAYFRVSGTLMAVSFALIALAPGLPIAFVGLALAGAAATTFQIFLQSRLQLEADDAMSGRILALFSVALVGTRPIGALLTGILLDLSGPRFAWAVFAVVVGLLVLALAIWRLPPRPAAPVDPTGGGVPAAVEARLVTDTPDP